MKDGIEKLARDEWRDGMSSGALARHVTGWLPKDSMVKWMLEDLLAAANFAAHDRHMVFVDFDKIDEEASAAAKLASFYRTNGRSVDPVPSVSP